MILAVSRGELESAVESVAAKVAAMVNGATTLGRRVPRSSWTAAQAAAHLAISQELFTALLAGGSHPYGVVSPEGFASVNERLLAEASGLDAPHLAKRILDATQSFLRSAATIADDTRCNSPLGVMSVTTVMSYDLCHLLAHGHGIATATGAESPIARSHARLAMPFLEHSTPVAYSMQPKRVHASVAFHVRQGPRFTLACDEQASMRPNDGAPVDATISVGAVAMLRIALGLESLWRAAARGDLMAWGRRPWVAVRIKGLLPNL